MGTKTSSNEPSRPEVPVSDLAQSLVVPTSVKTLTESAARYLEKQSLDIVPQAFQSLVKKSKTTLIEVACSPESRLSSEVQKLLGDSHAAIRCSHWNGCDLGESNGVKRILETIDMNQPEHVWISPECGPYSPMQAINQRTAAQTEELQNKRRIALKQYIGASCVFQYCFQKGIHATWEWSQYCQGWRLPFMQRLIAKCNPYFGVTHGCRVGVRDPKSHTLVKKGWKLMSTSRRLTEAMNLPCICPKTYQHARCEGGLAGLTAYYTPEFVHKVAQLVIQEMSHDMVHEELKGSTVLPKTFGEGTSCVCGSLKEHGCSFSCGHCHQQNSVKVFECEHEKHENKHDGCFGCHHAGQKHVQDEAFVQQFVSGMSSAEIQRKLYLLHAATGHGSVRNMVRALERRQAPKEVLDAARQFQCSVCKEKQRVNFKHTASLEPLPAKFAVVAADGGKWTHPITQEEYEFACIIDEGSRYRVARILKQGKKQTMNAAQFTQYFREGWMQYFGCPNTLRLDPAGCFRSHQLERFCDDHSIFLDVRSGRSPLDDRNMRTSHQWSQDLDDQVDIRRSGDLCWGGPRRVSAGVQSTGNCERLLSHTTCTGKGTGCHRPFRQQFSARQHFWDLSGESQWGISKEHWKNASCRNSLGRLAGTTTPEESHELKSSTSDGLPTWWSGVLLAKTNIWRTSQQKWEIFGPSSDIGNGNQEGERRYSEKRQWCMVRPW